MKSVAEASCRPVLWEPPSASRTEQLRDIRSFVLIPCFAHGISLPGLYPVTKGPLPSGEHWDGIMEKRGLWSTDMNSFNHYAYGAVADWVYEAAAGIQTVEDALALPG